MGGFHNNKILQAIISDIIVKLGVTSFVETGTYGGDTTTHMAIRHPNLPIFTCEINENFFNSTANKLRIFKNINSFRESSEKFIERLILENKLGDLPFFFLDAHWYDYWPLADEVKNISKLPKFVLMPDDFQVPGRPEFGNDGGGGGTIGVHRTQKDTRPCSIELFEEFLPRGYTIGYPNYSGSDVPEASHLRGHAFIICGVAPEKISEIKLNTRYDWK